jgi:hypothetical protein
LARLYASTSFRPIINDRLDPVADEKDETIIVGRTKREQKREGSEGLLDFGVVCEKQASGQSYHGYRVLMDAKFPHIIFICGKRGGGKSYTLGVIAEELCKTRIGIGTVIVDPIGIYWSMKKGNQSKKEARELERWGLKPMALDNVRVVAPLGVYDEGSDLLDGSFSIKPSELTSEEWCMVFGLDRFKIQGLLVGEALDKVREGYKVRKGPNEVEFIPGKGNDYTIEDIVDAMDRDVDLGSDERGYARTTRRSVIARFKAAERWGIFSEEGTPINEISVWDRVTVVDVSHPKLENQIRALIVGILARKILQARMMTSRMEEAGLAKEGGSIPVTWLMLDEAHLLIPRRGMTAASKPLIEYAKLGRKPGCALVLATQRPAATDDDVLSQVDILVGHSLGLEDDIAALLRRVPAKLPSQLSASDFIRAIPTGFGLLADQKTQQRTLVVQIRPRFTHHSGKEAMPAKQPPPPEPAPEQPAPASPVSTGAPEIASVWGEDEGGVAIEKGPVGSAPVEEEFEIVAASAVPAPGDGEIPEPGLPSVQPPDDVDQEVMADVEEEDDEFDGDVEAIPGIVLGTDAVHEDDVPIYADSAIIPNSRVMQPDLEDLEYADRTDEESPAEGEEVPDWQAGPGDDVGLGVLSEAALGEPGDPQPESGPGSGDAPEEMAPEVQAEEATENDSFPVVLRRDSAQGLAVKGMKTRWNGKPKEYVESIELVRLPMYESELSAEQRSRIGRKVTSRSRVLFDAHNVEIVSEFRKFSRSRGLKRLSTLGNDYLRVLGCMIGGEFPEACEGDLGMDPSGIRQSMVDLADKEIIDITQTKDGYLRGSLSKQFSYPTRPEKIRGQLPSSDPSRLGRVLEERIDKESLRGLIRCIYPRYEIETLRRIHMPYYEINYASDGDSRKEYVNAFTGLFEKWPGNDATTSV